MLEFVFNILRAVLVLALLGCISVLVGMSLQHVHWSFDLAGQFLLPVVIVAGVSSLLAILARAPTLASICFAVAAIGAITSAQWTALPVRNTGDAPRFSVLLYNVWWANKRLDAVADMIKHHNPDMVVILEASARVRNELQALAAHYPYRLDCIGSHNCDVLMFSRSRLTAHHVKSTSDAEHSPLLQVRTEIAGCPMMVFATHMTRPFPNKPYGAQREQAVEIGNDIGAWKGAKLVVGDFNGASWGYVMREVARRGKVDILRGPGGTWPFWLPQQLRIPIDHMLAGPGLSFVSRKVLSSIGSDHAPVLAEVAVTEPHLCR